MLTKLLLPLFLIFLISSSIVLAQDYMLNAVDYPNEIMVEKGWTSYFNVVVKNTGTTDLSNVSISFGGDFSNWFEVMTKEADVLHPNDNLTFVVKMSVPNNTEQKSYSFALFSKSKEAVSSNTFSVMVFNSKADSMLYQVQEMETEIDNVRTNATDIENSGKDVAGVLETLSEAKNYLNTSSNYIASERYQEATDMIISAGNLITKATYDLSIAPPKVETGSTIPYYLAIAAPFIAVIAVGFYFLRVRRRTPTNPASKIKRALVEDSEAIKSRLSDAESSKKLIEDEFNEKLITKESYDELMRKYEKVISDTKAELEKKK